MYECCDTPTHLCHFPAELLIYIFKLFSAKNLITCRQVCKRWKEVVDDLSTDDILWERHCGNDYKTIYRVVKDKSKSCSLWFDIYRSLSLWGRLTEATESRDEFCHSPVIAEAIENVTIMKNAVVAVHRRISITFFDILTFEPTGRTPIHGEYSKFVECDDVLIVMGIFMHLYVIKGWRQEPEKGSPIVGDEQIVIPNAKHFFIIGRKLYVLNYDSDIFICNMDEKLTATRLPHDYTELIVSMSFYNGSLHAVSAERNVYIYENNKFVKLFTLDSKKDNVFDCIYQYEFIDSMDWRIMYYWLANLRIPVPQGPLGSICMMRVYGDMLFFGCKNGVVMFYYKPFTNGQLDLLNHKPIKQYNFGERDDIPVLSLNPILSIDVLEIQGGHKVLIGMPKKVIVLTFQHNFEIVKSKAVVPYIPPVLAKSE